MRVVRGRAGDPDEDRQLTDQLVAWVTESGDGLLRVWQPHRQVAFGRRDTNRSGYEQARRIVADRDIHAVERGVGGHAVFFTGTTLAFLRAQPVDDLRSGITERYEAVSEELQDALAALGVEAQHGEPDSAFCPGTHSLSATGKLVGLAQRVRRDVAVIGGILVVADHEEIGTVLDPIYDAVGVPFDPATTGSIARAGGNSDPAAVRRELERALVVGEPTVECVK